MITFSCHGDNVAYSTYLMLPGLCCRGLNLNNYGK